MAVGRWSAVQLFNQVARGRTGGQCISFTRYSKSFAYLRLAAETFEWGSGKCSTQAGKHLLAKTETRPRPRRQMLEPCLFIGPLGATSCSMWYLCSCCWGLQVCRWSSYNSIFYFVAFVEVLATGGRSFISRAYKLDSWLCR